MKQRFPAPSEPDAPLSGSMVLRRTRQQLVAEAGVAPLGGLLIGLALAGADRSAFSLSLGFVVASVGLTLLGGGLTAWWIAHERVELNADHIIVVTRYRRRRVAVADVTEVGRRKVLAVWYPCLTLADGTRLRAYAPNTAFWPFIDPDFDAKLSRITSHGAFARPKLTDPAVD